MKELVVLIGLPGSGKTSFRNAHPQWGVVSKDDIRRNVFHRDFDPEYEDAVDRIFAAMLVEAVDSPAQVVCVDNTNITRAARKPLIEVARLSGRLPIAYVMPLLPMEIMYERKLKQLEELSRDHPEIRVGGFPRERYESMYRSYEEVSEKEGFARVFRNATVALPRKRRVHRSRRAPALEPLPLLLGESKSVD